MLRGQLLCSPLVREEGKVVAYDDFRMSLISKILNVSETLVMLVACDESERFRSIKVLKIKHPYCSCHSTHRRVSGGMCLTWLVYYL